MKKEEELKIKSQIVDDVMEEVKEMVEFERNFVDNFGMSMDQFERLDYDEQEVLIDKVARLNNKKKHLLSLKELFKHYPIFEKTRDKRKRLFKKK